MNLKKRKHNRKRIIIITLIFLIFGVIFMLKKINDKITPLLIETAELEINKFSTIVINKAVSQVLEDKINDTNIFSTKISNDGKIQTIDFNPIEVNQVLNIATTVVQNNLRLLEEGKLDNIGIYDLELSDSKINSLKKGIIAEIPIGIIFDNTLLSNIGPKIPIRLHYLGDVNSNITTKITPYGINNALIEVGVKLEITAQIILPFITKKYVIECTIPLAIKMIQGTVPNYFGGTIEKNSNMFSNSF